MPKTIEYTAEDYVEDWRSAVLEALDEQGVSMSVLARKVEMHPAHISRTLGGHHTPNLLTCIKVCRELNISLPEL